MTDRLDLIYLFLIHVTGQLLRQQMCSWTCEWGFTQGVFCVVFLGYASGSMMSGPMMSLLPIIWRLEGNQG